MHCNPSVHLLIMATIAGFQHCIASGKIIWKHCLAIGMDICTHKFLGSEHIASSCGGANQSNC